MVEITTKDQNKEKRMKMIEDCVRDLWNNIKNTNIWFIWVPEKDKKKKGYEKVFEEIIVKNSPNMGKESHSSSGSPESPIQDKPKQKRTKTHINQTNKN